MANKDRTSMAVQKQILLLSERGYPIRKIAECLNISRKTVRKFINKGEDTLEDHDCGQESTVAHEVKKDSENTDKSVVLQSPQWLQQLDWEELVLEVSKGVPLKILWQESVEQGCPVKYWAFCHAVRALQERIRPSTPKNVTVHLEHRPGEKAFVDYCDGLLIHNAQTGKDIKTQLFVGVMPFSGKVYAEFSMNQKTPTLIQSCERMWAYFGGVAPYLVCDNLKSGVTRADIYDPDVNKIFCDYANHAGFAVLPARPYKPKDKASVERHVGLIQERFYPLVRKKIFYNIEEINLELKDFLKNFNDEIMREYGVSRNQRFEPEKPLLMPLPANEFEISEWKICKVHPDFHIEAKKAAYSVPYSCVGKEVNVEFTAHLVNIYDMDSHQLITSHNRSDGSLWRRHTHEEHWPMAKREQMQLTMEKCASFAKTKGEHAHNLVVYLSQQERPLQYLRMAQGLNRLYKDKKYSSKCLELACKLALEKGVFKLSYIKAKALNYARLSADAENHVPPVRKAVFLHSDLHNKGTTTAC